LQSLSRDVAAELLATGARHEVPATFAQTLDRHLYDLQDALRGPRERTESKEWPAPVVESLERLQALLDEFVAALGEAAKDHAGLAALRRRGAELAARLRMLVSIDEDETASVRWAQSTMHGISLHYVPVDVAEQLGALVESHTSAWICTSATLPVGESFNHFMS